MIKKFTLGKPYDTGAVVRETAASCWDGFPYKYTHDEGFSFEIPLGGEDIVYGLGETTRGINKRGWIYESWCSDDPFHTEGKRSLYAAHNFIIVSGAQNTGIFIDFPSRIRWDIGYSKADTARIELEGNDFDVYIIEGGTPRDVVREFRALIGKSYLPPFWAFGFQQSRWSYHNSEAVDRIIDGYDRAGIPLDCVYLDIDYMDSFKDFTVDGSKFPDFERFVAEKKEKGIRLIPIIDAGIKAEEGYEIFDEGVKNGYFCKKADGSDFEAGVWPGICRFPDFLRDDVREWFGSKYKKLIDMGIEGFWNDMNEPALFYSADGIKNALEKASSLNGQNLDLGKFFNLKDTFAGLSNNGNDYASIYHTVDGEQVNHQAVHNLYGANMTRAAGEYFEKEYGEQKILMFSRASYIGAHRCGGDHPRRRTRRKSRERLWHRRHRRRVRVRPRRDERGARARDVESRHPRHHRKEHSPRLRRRDGEGEKSLRRTGRDVQFHALFRRQARGDGRPAGPPRGKIVPGARRQIPPHAQRRRS